jgi:hypothetical protein
MQHLTRLVARLIIAVSGLSAPALATPPPAPTALVDLGGRTWLVERDGYRVMLAFDDERVRVFLAVRGIVTGLRDICVTEAKVGVPARLECPYGRQLSLQPTATGYEVTLEGSLVDEARPYWGSEQPRGPQGPIVYQAVPVDPVETVFREENFTPSSRGNSSPETKVLESVLPMPTTSVARAQRRVERALAVAGVDPGSVPVDLVRSLWRDAAQGRSDSGLANALDQYKTRLDKRRAAAVAVPGAVPAAPTP